MNSAPPLQQDRIPQPVPVFALAREAPPHPEDDPALFLDTARLGCSVASYNALWRWLQEEVQHWLPHEALIVGWRDAQAAGFETEILSSLPGLRSRQLTPPWAGPLLDYLASCWVGAQMAPCQVDLARCSGLPRDGSPSARAIAGMNTALVHGTREGLRRGERLVVALTWRPGFSPGCATALKVLQPIIDTAVRRLPRQDMTELTGMEIAPSPGPDIQLSGREREIMGWVALGKTNPEIGEILRISQFTVKNHMKTIFRKLDVSSRAQAVASISARNGHA